DVGARLAQRADQLEAIAVAQPEIEHGEGRRSRGLRQRLGHRPHGRHDEAAQLERAGDAVAERRIVIGNQQRAILVCRHAGQGGRHGTVCTGVLGHGQLRQHGRYVALKTGFGQRTATAAPPSAELRLPKITVAPVRSSSVLAMKTPSPMWPSSPWRVEMKGVPSSSSRASEKPGPSSDTSTSAHSVVQRVAMWISRRAKEIAFCTILPTTCMISGLRTWIGAVAGAAALNGPASNVMTMPSLR